ncbi:hypothetical protein [Marinifilum caeruleilacunae]|uniref:Uncharacterized protein n=1 Tax=Marinifilum caeruleilacunae TaxID=2499076 RepID=A0ABX1WR40_9BACT|nr:hypothetical protein [Marinifilum caeruleilacunae]NOU58521.1 hypothetical protein [Marinifilum caeruleilacunae]
MKLRIKNTKITIWTLSIYQIIGGLLGIYVTAYLMTRTHNLNGTILLIFLLAAGLYLFSIKSGIALLQKDYRKGLIYSMINQVLQIVSIAVGGYKFDYFSGSKFTLGCNFTDGIFFNFNFGLTSEFNFSYNVDKYEYYLHINILAILILYVLNDLYKELYSKRKIVLAEDA